MYATIKVQVEIIRFFLLTIISLLISKEKYMIRTISSKYDIIILAVLLSLLSLFALLYGSVNATVEDRGSISISFAEPVAIDSVVKTLNEQGMFDMASAQSSFSINGTAIQDFVTITRKQDVADVQAQWLSGRKLLVEKLKKDGYFNGKNALISGNPLTEGLDVFVVKNITVYGEKAAISGIATRLPGTISAYYSASNRPLMPNQSHRAQPVSLIDDEIALAAVANTPYYLSLPVSGSVTTGLFTAPGVTNPTRGAVNYMTWNSNGFASDQTYEHDFFLNASGGTYFARSFSLPPYCQPNAVYAATSWSSASYPYLDSNLESNGLCSSSGYIAYTIGAAQANAITTGTQHFTAILMLNGDASTDTSLLQGQIGYQWPVGCHSTLCSYPYGYGIKETTHYNFLVNGAVPGSQSWTNVGYIPNTPDQVSVTNPTASSLRLNFRDITWDETNISAERWIGTTGMWTAFNFGILNAGNAPGNWYWNNTGLVSGTTYCYRMRATNAKGSSPYSPVTATTCGTTL